MLKRITLISVVSIFCFTSIACESSYDRAMNEYEDAMDNYNDYDYGNNNDYKYDGGSSSKTCQTCGYQYTSLPYKGSYCSSSCCKVWSSLGDPGCGSW